MQTAPPSNFQNIVSDPYHTLITEKNVARLLSWNVRTVQLRRYLKQEPPYLRMGRNIRYRLSVVLAMLEAGEVKQQRDHPGELRDK